MLIGNPLARAVGPLIGLPSSGGGGAGLGPVPVVEAWVQSNSVGGVTAEQLFTAPAGIVEGSLCVIIACDDSSAGTNMTMSASGWQKEGGGGDGSSASIAVFWKIATGAEGNQSVQLAESRRCAGWYMRISGAHQTTPMNISTFTGGFGTAPNIPIGTTTAPNCLLLGGISFDDDPTFTWNTVGWNETNEWANSSFHGGSFGQNEQVVAGATPAGSVTSSTSNGHARCLVAVAPS